MNCRRNKSREKQKKKKNPYLTPAKQKSSKYSSMRRNIEIT